MDLGNLVGRRVALENRLQNEREGPPDARTREYEREYRELQKELAAAFRRGNEERERITLMLEMMRILENRLVYLQNFVVDATPDDRALASLVTRFIDQILRDRNPTLTMLEATYYRAVASLYAGDLGAARQGFGLACASEESDETNDIKYKSYVILGHLLHEARDYARARQLHDQSLRYSTNGNVTAQALALKALNSYALGEIDDALRLFRESLALFDPHQPFFNSYFYRNALLFCGAICFDRGDLRGAEESYARVVESVEQHSYDFFDALIHLGRIHYRRQRWDDALAAFEKAEQSHRFGENEYLVDTWFWIARAQLKRNDRAEARRYLEKVASSPVRYDKKPQAAELLRKIA
ncbi:MAG TPA: tetratricopeptide repeat protein [Thermoanaerobaculia bacterium]|nr:tetratricopeptide repeat protein [Thermoanaerobaculia bacterium]